MKANKSISPKQLLTEQSLIIIVLGVILILTYGFTLPYPFQFDDQQNIVHNPTLRIVDLSFKELCTAMIDGYKTRPISNLTLAISQFFGKTNPVSYRIVNLIIHFLNGVLVYRLLSLTLHFSKITANKKSFVPFWGAIIWFTHPIQIQAVTYIIQRMTSQATFFYLSSLIMYISGRSSIKIYQKILFYSGCFISMGLAFGSKEISLTLPFTLLAYDYFFISKPEEKKNIGLAFYFTTLIFSAILFVTLQFFNPIEFILNSYSNRPFTLAQRLLTEPRVVFFYLSLFFFPLHNRFSLDHHFPISTNLLTPPSTLVSILLITTLIFMTFLFYRKDYKIASFCVFWLMFHLVIESSFIGLEIVFEHRMYLPSIFIGFTCLVYLEKLINNSKIFNIFLSLLVMLLCINTIERNKVWSDTELFWQDAAEKAPFKSRPQGNYGYQLFKNGNYAQAEFYLKKALEINPSNIDARTTLGGVMIEKNDPHAAIQLFRMNLLHEPEHANSLNNLANTLVSIGEVEKAKSIYEKIIRLHPNFSTPLYRLGSLVIKEDKDRATTLFKRALRVDPNNSALYKIIGKIYYESNDLESAKRAFIKSISLKRYNPEAHLYLGTIYGRQNSFSKSIQHLTTALLYDSSLSEAKKNLKLVIAKQRQEQNEK